MYSLLESSCVGSIHQSVLDALTGRTLFATEDGRDTDLFLAHIAGMQAYLPSVMPLLAPNVNSYRRLAGRGDAPINVHWGHDNRTVGLRVPYAAPDARRVENRVPGVDANPYLAIAASLACGWLGMVEGRAPNAPVSGSAHILPRLALPRDQSEALDRLNASEPLRDILGARFVAVVNAVKQAEYDAYQRVISSWERENLLLNV